MQMYNRFSIVAFIIGKITLTYYVFQISLNQIELTFEYA